LARKKADPDAAASSSRAKAAAWYDSEVVTYGRLGTKVAVLLKELLASEGLTDAVVTQRIKNRDKLIEKATRYKDPQAEIHDLCGLRVVTSFPSEARRAAAKVREEFIIDEANSADKAADLGVDKVGYQAIHFVAQLGPNRTGLAEWRDFAGTKFEVQVRTILQDAWAEFEHDRNYKFAGELPPELERRLKLAAGLLEVADREFDHVALEVDKYAASVTKRAATQGPARSTSLDIPIDSVSLRSYLGRKFAKLVRKGNLTLEYANSRSAAGIVDELRAFGLETLADLDARIPDTLDQRIMAVGEHTNINGLARTIMMVANFDDYFQRAWKTSWTGADPQLLAVLASYGIDWNRLKEHGVNIDEELDLTLLRNETGGIGQPG
jgi:ppGpp synthetase/RelA/SpoT-type nucleotidyltranferase